MILQIMIISDLLANMYILSSLAYIGTKLSLKETNTLQEYNHKYFIWKHV